MDDSITPLARELDAAPAFRPPSTSVWPGPIDLIQLATGEPKEPSFTIQGWLATGYAALMSGHGGAGKSQIALALAVSVALGNDWCGIPVQRCRVLYLSCEDRKDVIHWRLSRLCGNAGVGISDLADWLHIVDLVGSPTILHSGEPDEEPTAAFLALAEMVKSTRADLIVIDGISDTFGGNENNRGHVKAYVNRLLSIVDPERGAVLLIGHVNKLSAQGGSNGEGYSGSTGWHNAVRARWYLRPDSDSDEDGVNRKTGALTLELQKSNLSAGDRSINFRWDDGASLFLPTEKETGTVAAIREQQERQSILDALVAVEARGDYCPAATTGRRTALHVLSVTGKLDPKLTGSTANTKRFWRHVEVLRQMGEISEGSIRRSNRHMTATLELAPQENQGMRQCAE